MRKETGFAPGKEIGWFKSPFLVKLGKEKRNRMDAGSAGFANAKHRPSLQIPFPRCARKDRMDAGSAGFAYAKHRPSLQIPIPNCVVRKKKKSDGFPLGALRASIGDRFALAERSLQIPHASRISGLLLSFGKRGI